MEKFVRPFEKRDTGPAKTPRAGVCADDPQTVIIQFGKGGSGRIFSTSYKLDIKHYMTKQQRELCEADDDSDSRPTRT